MCLSLVNMSFVIRSEILFQRRYIIKDMGQKQNRDFSFFLTVSYNSGHDEKCSWSNEFCPKSVSISSIIANTWLQYLLFRSERYFHTVFHFKIKFALFCIADVEKIEHKKVITTTNEACVLQNEVGNEF